MRTFPRQIKRKNPIVGFFREFKHLIQAAVLFVGVALALVFFFTFIMALFLCMIGLAAAVLIFWQIRGMPMDITKDGEKIGEIRNFKYYPKEKNKTSE